MQHIAENNYRENYKDSKWEGSENMPKDRTKSTSRIDMTYLPFILALIIATLAGFLLLTSQSFYLQQLAPACLIIGLVLAMRSLSGSN